MRKIFRKQPELLLPTDSAVVIRDTGACPAVLATASGGPAAGPRQDISTSVEMKVRDVVYLLSSVGVKPKNIVRMVVQLPQILGLPLAQMLAVTDYLVGLQFEGTVGSFYRQNPWVLAAPVGTVKEAVEVLVSDIGVRRLEVVVRAYPRALVKGRDDLLEPVELLLEVGVEMDDVVLVIEGFPLLLGLEPVAMRGVLAFWKNELRIRRADLPRICRAFPSLLGVDVEQQRKVVAFLREIGVVNVARFATRLPPVLAYDVEADLRPKMAHLAASGLSVYDVVRFPAYFAYPYDTVIRARTAFMEANNLPLARFELKNIFTPGDAQFAKRIVGVSPSDYAAFKATYLEELANPKPKPQGGKLAAFEKPVPSPSPLNGTAAGKAAFPTLSPGAPNPLSSGSLSLSFQKTAKRGPLTARYATAFDSATEPTGAYISTAPAYVSRYALGIKEIYDSKSKVFYLAPHKRRSPRTPRTSRPLSGRVVRSALQRRLTFG